MDYRTYSDIQWIESLGDRGKYLQIILGEVFKEGGCRVHECNLVEGKDLYLQRDGQKYGLEVKTCESMKVTLGDKDLRDIRETGREVRPGFAVLRIHPNAEWRITDPAIFEVGNQRSLPVTATRARPIDNLQEIVRKAHDETLQRVVAEMKKEGYAESERLGIQTLKGKLLEDNSPQ